MDCGYCNKPIPVQGQFYAGMVCTCPREQVIRQFSPPRQMGEDWFPTLDDIRRVVREEIRAALKASGSES